MSKKYILEISNFRVHSSGQEILKGIDLSIEKGSVHAIMGPNGSGKSTLAMAIMGHPGFGVSEGSVVRLGSKDALGLTPDQKARLGLFVSFQSPVEIAGVSFLAFVRTAYKELHPSKKIKLSEFKRSALSALKKVGLDESFLTRSLNEGFSGGERKRAEIAQILILKPRIVILDEIDSGLDIDSLKVVSSVLARSAKRGMTIIMITHYQRILRFVRPNRVHILVDGRIKRSGGIGLVRTIEREGYARI